MASAEAIHEAQMSERSNLWILATALVVVALSLSIPAAAHRNADATEARKSWLQTTSIREVPLGVGLVRVTDRAAAPHPRHPVRSSARDLELGPRWSHDHVDRERFGALLDRVNRWEREHPLMTCYVGCFATPAR
jgi:hypothetical protein